MEQGYIVGVQAVPGLSGALVMPSNSHSGAIRARTVPPYVIGVIKDLLLTPAGGSQGAAVIQTGDRLRELLRVIAHDYGSEGPTAVLDQ
jgi:hypothetical protein